MVSLRTTVNSIRSLPGISRRAAVKCYSATGKLARGFINTGQLSYQSLFGTREARFWTASTAVSTAYIGSALAYNAPLIVNTALAGNIGHSLLYLTQMASFSFFSILAVTMPTMENIAKFFYKPDVKPKIPSDKLLPKVTVQIPCRNEPLEVLKRDAIASALALDYPAEKLEIQVLDNSDPGRYEELEAYCQEKGIVFIHRDGTEGAKAHNLNLGLARATGEYVLMFDADNRAEPDFLKSLVAEILTDDKLAYVFSSVDYWNAEKNPFTRSMSAVNLQFRSAQWLLDKQGIAPFNGYGVLLSKEKMAEVGNWDEKMAGEDWDLSLSLYRAGYSGKRVSHTTVHDALPENLLRFQVQQRRWAFGSAQTAKKHLLDIWRTKHLNWYQKLNLTYRISYYPGLTFAFLLPALSMAPLYAFSMANGEGQPESLINWWLSAWVIASCQPVLSYYASKASGAYQTTKKTLLYFFPGLFAMTGAQPEIANGVNSLLKGNDEGFKITPKGQLEKTSILQAMKRYRTELLAGGAILTTGMVTPATGSLFVFIGLGLFSSPLISWLGERKG